MNDGIPKNSPAQMAAALCETLGEERDVLVVMHDRFAAHHEALRARRRELIEDATNATNELVSDLWRIRQARERQLRLLARVLKLDAPIPSLTDVAGALRARPDDDGVADHLLALREEVRTRAGETKRACQELEFALQYAMDLGRELLQVVQGVDADDESRRVYDQRGAAAQATPQRSYLNKIG